jgi:hypothetical protein
LDADLWSHQEDSLSEFHYVRTLGVDGGVDACDGPAIGVDLETILKDGLPPHKVALEIVAALCEILDIADEDGEIHGDVTPEFVFIDDTGAISIEGFGTDRDSSHAPEVEPEGTFTDLYGLGWVTYRLLTTEPLEPPLDDPDEHDDEVIDAIIGLNLRGIPEEFHGDIQWFLAKLMAFEPDDRPSAEETWKAYIAFADETDGPLLDEWAPDGIEGGGERRSAQDAGRAEPPEDMEALSGPTKEKGPLARGAIDFDGGGAKPGSATAFWSKDAMKAALAEPTSHEEEEEVGGGGAAYQPSSAQATSFWSKSDMEAMRQAPKRGSGREGARAPKATPPGGPGPAQPPPAGRPPGPAQRQPSPPQQPVAPAAPPQVDQGAAPRQAGPPGPGGPSIAQGPTAQAPAAAAPGPGGPVAQMPGAPGMPGQMPPGMAGPQPGEEEGGNKNMMIIGIVVGVLVLLCLGIGGVAGLGVLLSGGDDAASTDVSDEEDEGRADEEEEDDRRGPTQDTAVPEAEPKEPAAPISVGVTSTTPAPAPKPVTRTTTPRPRPKPKPAPAPAATTGKVRVTFNVGQRGTIGCSDGQRQEVDGSKSMEFEGYNMPISCMLEVQGGMWAGLLESPGTVRCTGSGASFSCSGP